MHLTEKNLFGHVLNSGSCHILCCFITNIVFLSCVKHHLLLLCVRIDTLLISEIFITAFK